MTPTAAELLRGIAVTLAIPPAAEDMALFLPARLGIIAIISIIVAQEAERGVSMRVAENAAIRAVLADAADAYPVAAAASDASNGDLSIAALDAANAALRRHLTALHIAAEAADDRDCDRAILTLYRRMAEGRRLELPLTEA